MVTLLCPAPQPDQCSPLPSLPEASGREQGWKKTQVWGAWGMSRFLWLAEGASVSHQRPPQGSIEEAPCLPVFPKLRQTPTDVTPMSPTLRSLRQVQGGSTPRVQSEVVPQGHSTLQKEVPWRAPGHDIWAGAMITKWGILYS